MPAIDSNTKLLIQNEAYNAQSKAIYFDGTGDYLTTPYSADFDLGAAGSGDFTVEGWVRFLSVATGRFVATENGTSGWSLGYASSQLQLWANGVSNYTSWTPVANKWYHFAAVRSGSTITNFINGKSLGTGSDLDFSADGQGLAVGATFAGGATFNGWLKNVRLTKGLARYTANFTPSTTLFSSDSNTKLLLLAEETNGATTFTDSEGTPKTVTTNGNCVLQYTSDYRESIFVDTETSPKAITDYGDAKIISQAFNKSSGFFDGSSSDSLKLLNCPEMQFTGDLTVEHWTMWTTVGSNYFFARNGLADWGWYYDGPNARFGLSIGNVDVYVPSYVPKVNIWYHLAIVRSSGVWQIYINGIPVSTSYTNSSNLTFTSDVFIGNTSSLATYTGKFWLKEYRVSNSARYTATFTPSTTQFTTDSNTKLLLHFDTPATAPLAPCIFFDGTGDYLTVPDSVDWDMGASDYTFEGWYRFRSNSLAGLFNRNDGSSGFLLEWTSGGSQFAWTGFGGTQTNYAITPALNRWYHIAVTREGTVTRFFLDGQQVATGTDTGLLEKRTELVEIGAWLSHGRLFDGWMKNVRISKTCRYTATFTPSQSGFTNDSDTLLLLKGDESNGATTFIDSSTAARTVTTTGDVKIQYQEDFRTNVFKDSSVTDDTALTSALKFDGTGDNLTVPDSADFNFSGGVFTIEGWVRTSSLGAAQGIWGQSTDSNNYHYTVINTNGSVEYFGVSGGSANVDVATASGVIVTNRWYHIAIVENGNTYQIFIDGVDRTSSGGTDTDRQANYTGDFTIGAHRTTYFLTGWMRNFRVSNTNRYTTTFTPSVLSTDLTDDANTKLLITGSITGGTGQSKAIRFDGTGDYITAPDSADWDFGTGDFTVETWVRWNTGGFAVGSCLWSNLDGSNNGLILFYSPSDTKLYLFINSSSVSTKAEVWVPVINRWYHVACTRSGTTIRFFIDGVQLSGTTTNSSNITGSTSVASIGYWVAGTNYPLNGWIKQSRISNTARYTSDFTPSETQFANDSNTKLLILAEENVGVTTFSDSEGTPKTITSNGDVIIQMTPDYRNRVVIDRESSPKTITTVADTVIENQIGVESKHAYPVATTRAKVDFIAPFGNGAFHLTNPDAESAATAWLSIPNSSDFQFGTGDFAFDTWIRFDTVSYRHNILGTSDWLSGNGYGWFWFTSLGPGMQLYIANGIRSTALFSPVANTWYHIAIARSGTSIKQFANGTQLSSETDSTNASPTQPLLIGAGNYSHNGSFDNFRVSKGDARYTATFNPPTEDFANATGGVGFMAFFFD